MHCVWLQVVARLQLRLAQSEVFIHRKQVPYYPVGVSGSVGGLLYGGSSDERIIPVICGGTADNGDTVAACFALNMDERSYNI